ncbi:Nucleoporin p58/p45 [Dinochytrium kinnereticum]|nr:Nucleoporin p58/p45 [Dinochytrium kinnereticum]
MFGNKFGTQQQASAPAFGAQPAATPATGTTGFSFGAQAPAAGAAATSTGLNTGIGGKGFGGFGPQQTNPQNPAQPPATPFGQAQGSSLFGAQQQQPTATGSAPAPVAGPSPDAFTKSTRYGECPDNIRNQLDQIEQFIQSQKDTVEEIRSTTTLQEIHDVHFMCERINLKYQGLKNLLDRDTALIQNLRSTMASEMKNTDSAARFIDRYSNPHLSNQSHTQDVSQTYFANVTDQLESRLQLYRQTIDELERHFQSITQKPHYTPQAIADILRSQHDSFISIAGKISKVHDSISSERDKFLNYRKKYFGDARDPFKDSSDIAIKDTPLSAIATDLVPSVAPQANAPGTGFGVSAGGFGASTAPAAGFANYLSKKLSRTASRDTMFFEDDDDDEVSWGSLPDPDESSQTFSRRETILLPIEKRHGRGGLADICISEVPRESHQFSPVDEEAASMLIQRTWRRYREREKSELDSMDVDVAVIDFEKRNLSQEEACSRIQGWWRKSSSLSTEKQREVAAVRIQAFLRMVQQRRKYTAALSGIVRLQARFRSLVLKRRYNSLKKSAVTIQKWWKRKKKQTVPARRSKRTTVKIVNISLEEKKRALEKIRQKRLELQKQLTKNSETIVSPDILSPAPLSIPTPAESVSPEAQVPKSIELSPPTKPTKSTTVTTASSAIPLPSVILGKLTAKQLQCITEDNTRRNNGFAFCTIKIQVIKKLEPAPPSPSEKLKQQMKDKDKDKSIEDEAIDLDRHTKIQWRLELTEKFQYDPTSLIRPPSKKTSPAGKTEAKPRLAEVGKTCLKKSAFLPLSMDPIPRKVLVTVQRVEFLEEPIPPPEPAPIIKSPAVRKISTPGPAARVSKRAGTPMPARVKR